MGALVKGGALVEQRWSNNKNFEEEVTLKRERLIVVTVTPSPYGVYLVCIFWSKLKSVGLCCAC
jgi:hypothetical protein